VIQTSESWQQTAAGFLKISGNAGNFLPNKFIFPDFDDFSLPQIIFFSLFIFCCQVVKFFQQKN
jgi:hypothetical protein